MQFCICKVIARYSTDHILLITAAVMCRGSKTESIVLGTLALFLLHHLKC